MAQTVILGSGIIGVSIAYYLSDHQPGSSIHLVEISPELFASASGFAGGFLAEDWFGPDVAALGELSFAEHRKLAESEGGREQWGYSPSLPFSHASAPPGKKTKRGEDWLREGSSRARVATGAGHPPDQSPAWLRRDEGDHVEMIGDEGSTAQVDPRRLCEFLLGKCLERGVQLHHPAVALSVKTDLQDELASVRIGRTEDSIETDFPCTRLVIAAGAWTPLVFTDLFRLSTFPLPVMSLAGHSLVIKSPCEPERSSCCAVFSTDGPSYSPELISRVGGEIYIAGLNHWVSALPKLPTKAEISPTAIETLKTTAQRLVGSEGEEIEVLREGLCFRPVTPSGKPILSRVRDEHLGIKIRTRQGSEGGVFIAVGHGPWGIALSLGTGKVMAEMMQGREMSADISSLALS